MSEARKCPWGEDALPLYRQAKIFKNRFGVPFTDTTLSSWMIKGSEALKPVIDLLKLRLLENKYIQADETTLQVLNKKSRKASQKSYIWLGVGMDRYPVVYMKYADNRSATVPTEIFTGFNGYLQTDGYRGYNEVVKQESMTLGSQRNPMLKSIRFLCSYQTKICRYCQIRKK